MSERSALSFAIEAIQRSDWTSARVHAESALAGHPDSADAHHLLGAVCWRAGDTGVAIRHLEESVRLRANPAWLNNLGVAYAGLGRWTEACSVLERSLALNPDHRDTLAHYGRTLCELGRFGAARGALERALQAGADEAGPWADLGWALSEIGELDSSRTALLRALELQPAMSRAVKKLIRVCDRLGLSGESVVHAQTFVELHPGAESFTELALALWRDGGIEAALKAATRAFSFGITSPEFHSGLLYLMLFAADISGSELAEAHRSWGITHGRRHSCRPGFERKTLRSKVRLGYIAAELHNTPAQHSRLPLLANADTEHFDVFVYGTQPLSGGEERYRALPGAYRNVHSLSASDLVERIREDQIDVLVDLVGHHSFGRVQALAERAAPVQISYSTYPGTSGVEAMDYVVTDAQATPPGTEHEYTEQVWRLSSGFLLYSPPAEAPEVLPLPARSNGHITFGLFQREAKLNGPCWDAVAGVLRNLPNSRLLVHHEHPNFDRENVSTQQRIIVALGQRGVARDRVSFKGGRPMNGHLAILSEADLALDTFPYNGHTITCECLWMGVPVVTLAGDRHAARIGTSILTEAGLTEWIARTTAEYVEVACREAQSLEKLAELRTSLRRRFAACGMVSTRKRTREIEGVYVQTWRAWLGKQISPPQGQR